MVYTVPNLYPLLTNNYENMKIKMMKFILSIFILLVSFNSSANIPEFATRCVGEKGAKKNAIFLHGMLLVETLPKGVGPDEASLAKLAKTHDYRIAIPRSHIVCKQSSQYHCWGDTTSIESTYAGIVKSAAQCFDTKKPFVAIGFSDGGYHLARALMRGVKDQPEWSIAIGSAGNIAYSNSNDLRKNTPITLLTGKSDGVFANAKSFVSDLKKKGAKVDFKTYSGGHVVPFDVLGTMLATS